MKELSIEEKATRYDEALKKAKDYHKQLLDEDNPEWASEIEKIFPELKESEDERIRNWLIGYFHQYKKDGIEKYANSVKVDSIIAWLEKQGEQKPVNKVEPKFKIGDWVVFNDNIYHIGNIALQRYYECLRVDGTVHTFSLDIDSKSHLWTIQDAKDGDVLTCYSDIKGKPIEQTGILKQYVGRHGGCSNSFIAYIGIDWDSNIVIDGYMGSTNIFPATKEQRDTLIKAMADAGYTFDFEKKELKKIEQKSNDKVESFDKYEGLTDFERTLADICIGWIGEELGWKQYIKDKADVLLKIAIKKFNSVQDAPFEQNHAWSEEDEKAINDIMWIIEAYRKNGFNETHVQMADNSEKWLKSLRPQSHWKPSDEQIEALESATENCAYSEYQDCLRELIEQLKKLKE